MSKRKNKKTASMELNMQVGTLWLKGDKSIEITGVDEVYYYCDNRKFRKTHPSIERYEEGKPVLPVEPLTTEIVEDAFEFQTGSEE